MSPDMLEQLKEALGKTNKYYCSQYYGFEVTDSETLLRYYIKHIGAKAYREKHPSSSQPSTCKLNTTY